MSRAARRPVAAVLAVACAAALAACSGSSPGPSPSGPSPSRPATGTPAASTAPTPQVSLPPSVASALPVLPSGLGGADACAHATTPFTAASAYLSLAQLGETALAQRCVQGGAVPESTTAGLRARSVAGYFIPSGSTGGTTIGFRRIDATSTATITLARSGDHWAVTGVGVS